MDVEDPVEQSDCSILVVDDEESIIESVTFALEREGYKVFSALSGLEALRLFHQEQPSMVILDLMLPDLSGLEVCRNLRTTSRVPILMLTARDQWQDKVLGLETGADDYLVKPFKFQELVARVRALLRRVGPVSKLLAYGELGIDPQAHTASYQGRPLSLTLREYQLLEWLIPRPNTVFSKEQLFREICGWEGGADTNLVEVHISALRAKIGDKGKRLIRTVRGVGYSLG